MSAYPDRDSDAVPVVLDTDTGDDVDDVFAIALAAVSPRIDLRAVITAHGDTRARARLARRVLEECGRGDVPVFAGERPNFSGLAAGTSMDSGAGFIPDDARVEPGDGVDALLEMVNRAPGQITVCAVGPLTNLAHAIRQDPGFAANAARLLIMGGEFPDGPRGEYNFNCDPDAARVVIESGAETWLGLIGPTRRAQIGTGESARLRESGLAIGASLAGMLDQYLAVRDRVRTPMFDGATLGDLIWPELYSWRDGLVGADVEAGRMRLREGSNPARLMEDLDPDRFCGLMLDAILTPA